VWSVRPRVADGCLLGYVWLSLVRGEVGTKTKHSTTVVLAQAKRSRPDDICSLA